MSRCWIARSTVSGATVSRRVKCRPPANPAVSAAACSASAAFMEPARFPLAGARLTRRAPRDVGLAERARLVLAGTLAQAPGADGLRAARVRRVPREAALRPWRRLPRARPRRQPRLEGYQLHLLRSGAHGPPRRVSPRDAAEMAPPRSRPPRGRCYRAAATWRSCWSTQRATTTGSSRTSLSAGPWSRSSRGNPRTFGFASCAPRARCSRGRDSASWRPTGR